MVRNNFAIILAAGDGKRLGSKIPKCFVKYKGREIYKYSLFTFCTVPMFKQIVLVVPKGYEKQVKWKDKRVIVVTGGSNRNVSFTKGIKALKGIAHFYDRIFVHDAARINVLNVDLLRLLNWKTSYATLCYKGPKNKSDLHVNGYNIQTPQYLPYYMYLLREHIDKKGKDLFTYYQLDFNRKNMVISTNRARNFKITYKEDLK